MTVMNLDMSLMSSGMTLLSLVLTLSSFDIAVMNLGTTLLNLVRAFLSCMTNEFRYDFIEFKYAHLFLRLVMTLIIKDLSYNFVSFMTTFCNEFLYDSNEFI